MTTPETRQLHYDEKAIASITMGEVIRQTANNFPEPRFRPRISKETTHYTIAGIDPSPYQFWVTADGIGTKPELAERLHEESKVMAQRDPSFYEGLAFDLLAMIDGDEARFGRFLVGVVEILDLNTAKNQAVVTALARGLKKACNEGHCALLNGETAELGYRTSGYGETRLNWNAVGVSIVVPDKLILGEGLKAGQPVVVFREKSIRASGLSKAREILEARLLINLGLNSKQEFVEKYFEIQGFKDARKKVVEVLRDLFGHDPLEQILLPWHQAYPEITQQLLTPSRLYGPIIYQAQGGVEGERKVKMVAAAHISGEGVPEKGKRMVEAKKMGIVLDPIFPDPEGITSLLRMVETFPGKIKKRIGIDDQTACEEWNRGVGFMVVTENIEEAKKLIAIAQENNCEAGIAGEVIDKPEIHWRGHTWTYTPDKI